MASPSFWVFRRGRKWYSGWRDERGRSQCRAHVAGVSKEFAREFARKKAIDACDIAAGRGVSGKTTCDALEEFCQRQDVKQCTHRLNRRHLEDFLAHSKIRTVEELSERWVHSWLGALKARGCNPGGQSLALRVLRTFCRFCRKKRWTTYYPFEDFKIPKSTFTGRYLTDDDRARLLSINPRYDVDRHLNRALTFGLYSLLRISQVFHAEWEHYRAPDQLWVPGIKGQEGRWIRLHPKALAAMGEPKTSGQVFDRWATLEAFRESVKKKAAREKLRGVRFHETKHTGISALLEAGYSIPEVCKISGNSMRTIAHYAHVNEKRAFEKWQAFEYGGRVNRFEVYTAGIQQESEKQGPNRTPECPKEHQGENANRL
jgi:site-specific recombinase XerD